MSGSHRALVLVDVQQEYFDGPLEIQYPPREESLVQITRAIDAAVAEGVPVVVVQHQSVEGAPVFDPTGPGFALHPEVERRRSASWKSVVKSYGSVFAGTDLVQWLREQGIDTVTLTGYMTNNCILASAAEAEAHGLAAEVLSDATGAISLSNDAGRVDAKEVHTVLLTLLHSNFAAVTDTATWIGALAAGEPLAKDNLIDSAVNGRKRAHEA